MGTRGVVLRDARGVARILRLLPRMDGAGLARRIEGRAWCIGRVARRVARCCAATALARLACLCGPTHRLLGGHGGVVHSHQVHRCGCVVVMYSAGVPNGCASRLNVRHRPPYGTGRPGAWAAEARRLENRHLGALHHCLGRKNRASAILEPRKFPPRCRFLLPPGFLGGVPRAASPRCTNALPSAIAQCQGRPFRLRWDCSRRVPRRKRRSRGHVLGPSYAPERLPTPKARSPKNAERSASCRCESPVG